MSNSVKHIFEILTEVTIHKASGNKSCVTNTILSHPELIQHVLQFLETSDTKICVQKSVTYSSLHIFSGLFDGIQLSSCWKHQAQKIGLPNSQFQ